MSNEPTLWQQTTELGQTLKEIADNDPSGTPSRAATQAFQSWLTEAGPTSRHPERFRDVLENYTAPDHSSRDLHTLFEMLQPFIEIPDDEEDEPVAPARAFISLPLAP